MSTPVRTLASLAMLLVALLGTARAESPSDRARARAYFDRGKGLFDVGRYDEAVKEFAAGYALAPRPQFLLNLGQCYRQLGDLKSARDMYDKFLHDAPAGDPDRPGAAAIVRELEAQLAARAPDHPAEPPPPEPPPVRPRPDEAALAPMALHDPPAPPRRPFIRRHWWIIPTSIILAGGVAVGLYFALRPSDPCSGRYLDCVAVPR